MVVGSPVSFPVGNSDSSSEFESDSGTMLLVNQVNRASVLEVIRVTPRISD